ncbi:MAG TPA: DUF1080 domain-containing protein [Candidatus Acidoferrales bacterium]|nr:DUF1080 domain-containing protein [Candidatus Acidoferrales bacterium]
MFRSDSAGSSCRSAVVKKLSLVGIGSAAALLLLRVPARAQQAPPNGNESTQLGTTPASPGASGAPQAGAGRGRGFGFRRPAQADWNDHDGWVSMFDGKTLDNWKGNKNVWSVEDGQIVGTASPDNPVGTTYLIWVGGQPANFTLKLDFMLAGTAPNTGIQFRSFIRPPGFPGRGGVGFGGDPTVVCSDQEALNDLSPSTASAAPTAQRDSRLAERRLATLGKMRMLVVAAPAVAALVEAEGPPMRWQRKTPRTG